MDLTQLIGMTGMKPQSTTDASLRNQQATERSHIHRHQSTRNKKPAPGSVGQKTHANVGQKTQEEHAPSSQDKDTSAQDLLDISYAAFESRAPKLGDWVLMPSGDFARFTEHGLLGVDNRGVEGSESDGIVLKPKKTQPSKFNKGRFQKGNTVLLLDKHWVMELSPEHYEMAGDALALAGRYPDCETLLDAAEQNSSVGGELKRLLKAYDTSISSPPTLSMLDTVGLSSLIEPARYRQSMAERATVPEGLLIKTPPKDGDFVTSSAMEGQIKRFRNSQEGPALEDPDTQEVQIISQTNDLFVVKPAHSMQSRIDSDLAKKGETIFKLSRSEKKWHKSVPQTWLAAKEAQLGKSSSPEGPTP